MTLPPQILHTTHYKHEAWSVSKYVAHHRRPMTRKNCGPQLVVNLDSINYQLLLTNATYC